MSEPKGQVKVSKAHTKADAWIASLDDVDDGAPMVGGGAGAAGAAPIQCFLFGSGSAGQVGRGKGTTKLHPSALTGAIARGLRSLPVAEVAKRGGRAVHEAALLRMNQAESATDAAIR